MPTGSTLPSDSAPATTSTMPASDTARAIQRSRSSRSPNQIVETTATPAG
jgi:hypothetical protein